ncbi:MAG: hypothetical protein ABIG30_03260 [Candidatus Aenigmatarchaeota archaeon]
MGYGYNFLKSELTRADLKTVECLMDKYGIAWQMMSSHQGIYVVSHNCPLPMELISEIGEGGFRLKNRQFVGKCRMHEGTTILLTDDTGNPIHAH